MFAQLNIATGATTDKPAIPATVVKSSDANDGDVSVVKLGQGNLSGAELATNVQLATGLQLTVLGFNTTDSDPRIGRYTLESQSVRVVESGKLRSATFYRLNKTVDIYHRGGMVIDTTGRVVGIVDADPDLTNNQNRIVYPVSTIMAVLKAAGVHNTLGDSDKLFRAGLDAYFNGRYKTAIGDLDEVAKAVPTNLIAPQYRQNAVDRQKIEGDTSSGMPGWLVAVIAAVGGALFATAALTVALRARSRRRSRRRQQETEWEPRYPLSPAPPARPGSGDVRWASAYGPVSAPPTSGPPLPAPVSGSPASAPPVSSPPLSYQPDPMATQPVAWPPANAIPVAPSTMDTPAAPDPAPAPDPRTPNAWAPESAPPASEPTPPVTPVQPADRQSPETPEPIGWQQRPIRRRPAQDEPDGGEQPANPWLRLP